MFTGLVEEMGTLVSIRQDAKTEQWILVINAKVVLGGVKLGDSISVNGTCLTVTFFDAHTFSVGLSPETLNKTSLGSLKPGELLNLERSMAVGDKFGGHFVEGHVDGTGSIIARYTEKDALWIRVAPTDPQLLRYIVPKGYIAVDGTSLTVVEVTDTWFSFMLIQYTQQKVVQAKKKIGDLVNLEVDILGKYVYKYVESFQAAAAKAKL
eukprot:gb/GEZN01018947.1/.p1 GENE.gb/GEZN01018947.1/~~gb/GEZN01018947.1/.p1  ORF type:complete len:219 (-),score=19.02 gb/GEZN01018947.1/:80-706(-)